MHFNLLQLLFWFMLKLFLPLASRGFGQCSYFETTPQVISDSFLVILLWGQMFQTHCMHLLPLDLQSAISLRNSCFFFCRKLFRYHKLLVLIDPGLVIISKTFQWAELRNIISLFLKIKYIMKLYWYFSFSSVLHSFYLTILILYLLSHQKKILALNDANIIAYLLYLTIYVQQYQNKIRLLKNGLKFFFLLVGYFLLRM